MTLSPAGRRALKRLYDPAIRLTTPECRLRTLVLDQAGVRDHHTVLDVGSGTGSLLIMLATRGCRGRLFGVDADPEMLHLARSKAQRAHATVAWSAALAGSLPYASRVFDRVLTTWLLHHLTTEQKRCALAEMFRVLRSGGEMHIADWGKPHNRLMRAAALSLKIFEPSDGTAANLQGVLPQLCDHAGFREVTETGHLSTVFGTVGLLAARRP